MVTLFSPDRPEENFMQWYAETKSRCIAQIWHVTSELMARGIDAVLELGLVQLRDRAAFYDRVDGTDYDWLFDWIRISWDLFGSFTRALGR